MNEVSKIVMLPVESLRPYEKNARKHGDKDVAAIAESIKAFGFNDPIGIWGKDNLIVEGHGRLEAAKLLGMEKVPAIRLDHLTDEQRRAYAIAHNRTAELSEWDDAALTLELGEIESIDMGAFDLDVDFAGPSEVVEDEYEEPEIVEPRTKLGDVYQLGDHRLMCGDSTDPAVFDALMGGVTADICVTSPPYNVGHLDVKLSDARGGGVQKETQKKYINDDDTRTDEEYFDFICANIDAVLSHSFEVFYNVGVGAGSKAVIAGILYKYCDQFKDLMYWVKDNPMPMIVGNAISSAVELIICLGENGTRAFNHFGDRLFHGVIKGPSASSTNKYADIHKATFPVYLPSEIISRFSPIGGTVLDCFGGTGTTMIACEQLGRKCYMVELEPLYCDVIIDRWEQFTGRKAVKL